MVSVIIPNYNHAPYLKERIDSVLSQTYQDFEVIVLDDCSTDDSAEIIETYRDHPKVAAILYNEQNSGTTFKQWKKGMDLARGEWIWIAESDDYCEPSFLQSLVDEVNSCTGVVLAYCQSIMFTNNNAITYKTAWPHLSSLLKGRDWVVLQMLGTCGLVNASMAIFRKSVLQDFSWELTHFRLCGDWFFWTQVATKGDVLISGKYLNYFRKHFKSASNSASKNGAYYSEGIKVFHYAVKAFELGEDEIEKGLVRYVQHFFHNVSEIEDATVKKEAWAYIETIHPQKAHYILKELEKARQREKIKSSFQHILTLKWFKASAKPMIKTTI